MTNIKLIGKKGSNACKEIRKGCNIRNYTGKTKIMKPAINRKGYFHTVLIINGEKRQVKIHRLVAEAFINNTKTFIQHHT